MPSGHWRGTVAEVKRRPRQSRPASPIHKRPMRRRGVPNPHSSKPPIRRQSGPKPIFLSRLSGGQARPKPVLLLSRLSGGQPGPKPILLSRLFGGQAGPKPILLSRLFGGKQGRGPILLSRLCGGGTKRIPAYTGEVDLRLTPNVQGPVSSFKQSQTRQTQYRRQFPLAETSVRFFFARPQNPIPAFAGHVARVGSVIGSVNSAGVRARAGDGDPVCRS